MLPVTSLLAAALMLLIFALGLNVSRLRMRHGNTDDVDKLRAVRESSRAHGNTVEHSLPVLLVTLLCESRNVAAPLLGGIGIVFLVSRVMVTYGLLNRRQGRFRMWGMVATYLVELILALLLFGTFI